MCISPRYRATTKASTCEYGRLSRVAGCCGRPSNSAVALLLILLTVGNTVAQLQPARAEANLAAGVALLKSGDLDGAERVFSEAVRQGVKSPLVFHNLGVIAQQRGNHATAINQFRQSITLQPDYAPSRLLLGVSLLARGKNLEATAELERAARSMPNEPQAHLQLAKAYEASDNWMAAIGELQKLVNLDPQQPEYAYLLGRAWARLSEWSYQRIARTNPDSARLHQALGQEYAIQGKYELAIAAYEQAARSDPRLPEIHLALALLLLELKKVDEAAAEINLELKLVPESKAAIETRTKIEAAKAATP
jgi:tetratricopeptide (TPR) repeat protein